MTGIPGHMLDENRSLFLCGLSQFHGWLLFLWFYLVRVFVPSHFVFKRLCPTAIKSS